jgi:hypothetical protein
MPASEIFELVIVASLAISMGRFFGLGTCR